MKALHQFVPTFEPGAVGQHIVEVQRLARSLGLESEVFFDNTRPGIGPGRPYAEYGAKVVADPDDVLMYHVAIGSPVVDFLLGRRERIVLDHHNLTPSAFFATWAPAVAHGVAWALQQLADLAPRAVLGLADSSFNESQLVALGCRQTGVAPILLDVAAFGPPSAAPSLGRRQRGARWLFVSRLAPNKAQHDLLKAFAVYRRVYDDDARLWIVGPGGTAPAYDDFLRELTIGLALDGFVEITGGVTASELTARYRDADVFVSLSDHEGFAVTLLEAMHHALPIVAFDSTAVPETLGDGGLLIPTKSPTFVAAAVHRVVSDGALRTHLAAAGHERLASFAMEVTRERWRTWIESLRR